VAGKPPVRISKETSVGKRKEGENRFSRGWVGVTGELQKKKTTAKSPILRKKETRA